jgi:hypothetical protein
MREQTLLLFAKKYLWWQKPEEAVVNPERVLAATMNCGSLEDYQALYRIFGAQTLVCVLQMRVPGWFSPKSWSFWHRVLDLVPPAEAVPPPPDREL